MLLPAWTTKCTRGRVLPLTGIENGFPKADSERSRPCLPIYDLVKDRRVLSIEADRTVLEGARFMMENRIGALPVLRNGELVGIFSERDIMNRVVAFGRLPGTTRIAEVMTANPKSVSVDETMENCLYLMREFGFRHLPIVDGKELKGLVSSRDILLRYISQQEAEQRRIGRLAAQTSGEGRLRSSRRGPKRCAVRSLSRQIATGRGTSRRLFPARGRQTAGSRSRNHRDLGHADIFVRGAVIEQIAAALPDHPLDKNHIRNLAHFLPTFSGTKTGCSDRQISLRDRSGQILQSQYDRPDCRRLRCKKV